MPLNKKSIWGTLIVLLLATTITLIGSQSGQVQGFMKRNFTQIRSNQNINIPNKTNNLSKINKLNNRMKHNLSKPDLENVAEIQVPQYWINKFNQDFEIYLDDSFTSEEKGKLKSGLYKAVYIASLIDSYFEKPLPWTNNKSYYDWLNDAIKGFKFKDWDEGSWSDEGYIEYDGNNFLENLNTQEENDIWYDGSAGMGFFSRFIVITTHEARHGDGLHHKPCPPGTKTTNNTDESLREMGAHGVSFLFMHWMRHFLPEEIIESHTVQQFLVYSNKGFLERLCSFDNDTRVLSDEDNEWLKEVSGHYYDYDSYSAFPLEK